MSQGDGHRRCRGLGDWALRVVGGLVVVAGAVVTAVLEINLSMLRINTVRVPVSPLIAVAANLALAWFAYRSTGKRWAVALPAVVWVGLMIVAGRRTTEGDMLLTADNWVGQLTIFAGAVASGVGAYLLIVTRPAASAPTTVSAPTAGSAPADRGPPRSR